MKWIVLEENPKPDLYIAVIAVDEERILKVMSKPCSIFHTSDEALVRARQLRDTFNVRSIRIFYMDGNSAFI
jgi:hypothetical protein